MLNFGRKKQKKPEKVPIWFMWLMGGFVVYAVLSNLFGNHVSDAKRTHQQATGEKSNAPMSFSLVKGTSASGAGLPHHVRDIRQGSGNPAGCWHRVGVRYSLYNGDGELIERIGEDDEPHYFHLGARQVVPALERGVLAMRKGGERHITAQPQLGFDGERFTHPRLGVGDFIGYDVTLVEIERPLNLPFSDLGLRIYDEKPGEGRPSQCTDTVQMRARLYDAGGRALSEIPPVAVSIGEGVAPYAVERALMEMRVGGSRVVIAPAGYMRPLFTGENAPEMIAGTEGESDVDDSAETAEIQQTEPRSHHARPSPWQLLSINHDQAVIMEIEVLPPVVAPPAEPAESDSPESEAAESEATEPASAESNNEPHSETPLISQPEE